MTNTTHNFINDPIPTFKEITDEKERWKAQRAAIRQKILAQRLIDDTVPLSYNGNFYGSGDSGYYDKNFGNKEVDDLFSNAIDLFVKIDWYNNEGGGGAIIWNVQTDVMVIDAYWNKTEQVYDMENEVI